MPAQPAGSPGSGAPGHDLRHTGNTLAPTGEATTRELMNRMGHSTVRAAMIYQHLVGGRDEVIAEHVDQQIRKAKGTTARPDGDKDGKNKIE